MSLARAVCRCSKLRSGTRERSFGEDLGLGDGAQAQPGGMQSIVWQSAVEDPLVSTAHAAHRAVCVADHGQSGFGHGSLRGSCYRHGMQI